eukprot:5615559-Amphidinium_carterae.1
MISLCSVHAPKGDLATGFDHYPPDYHPQARAMIKTDGSHWNAVSQSIALGELQPNKNWRRVNNLRSRKKQFL